MLRRLLEAVVVHAEPNARGFTVEVKWPLAELTASGAFLARALGGIIGSERGTRTPDPRIMIPVL